MGDTIKCCYCAEDIQRAAVVCKHCGRDLPPMAQAATPVKPGHPVLTVVLVLVLLYGGGFLLSKAITPTPEDAAAAAKEEQAAARKRRNELAANSKKYGKHWATYGDGDFDVFGLDYTDTDHGTGLITGVLRNNSQHSFQFVTVKGNYEDKQGTVIDTPMDNLHGMAPGATWKFELIVTRPDEMAKYRITDVTAH